MNIRELETWFENLLECARFAKADDSVNGLQIGDRGAPVGRVAFSVDASLETMKRAKEKGAEALVAHHGLFWKKGERIAGIMYERVKFLAESGLALFAFHLPLDAHPEVGNNAVLARQIGLGSLEPFGLYHGITIGFSGRFPEPMTATELERLILPDGSRAPVSLAFGKEKNETCAVISGGAAFEVLEAIDAGLDAYVTGESSHSVYHSVLEAKINMICAGHYATETGGPKALMERLASETGLSTFFLDMPTGL